MEHLDIEIENLDLDELMIQEIELIKIGDKLETLSPASGTTEVGYSYTGGTSVACCSCCIFCCCCV
jgi:hypothetical protein